MTIFLQRFGNQTIDFLTVLPMVRAGLTVACQGYEWAKTLSRKGYEPNEKRGQN